MILASVSAHVCVFGALMFPLHEPAAKCLLLFRRCWSGQKAESFGENDGSGGRDGGKEKGAVCSNDASHEVLENTSASEGPGPEDTRHNLDGTVQNRCDIDDGFDVHADRPEEQTLLLRKVGAASREGKDRYIPVPSSGSENTADITSATESPFSPPNASNAHFGSRKSLNKIAHLLCLTETQTPHESSRQFSSSAQNIHRLHKTQGDTKETLARSLLNVEGRGSRRENGLDLRTISAFSSIQSLYSLGLPSAGDVVALSVDAKVDKDVEADNAGGGTRDGDSSNLAIFRNIPFLMLCLNLILSNMSCGIFNIHLPAFSQEVQYRFDPLWF